MNKKAIIATFTVAQVCTLLATGNQTTLVSDATEKASTLINAIEPGNMMLADYIKFGIKAEFLGTYEEKSFKDGSNENESDLVIDKIKMNLDIDVTENIKFDTNIEYKDGKDLYIDSAEFDISLNDDLSIAVGKIDIPFGVFEGEMISDPLTKDLGEITQTTIGLIWKPVNSLKLSAWVYDSDIEGEINNAAAALEFKPSDAISLGVGIVSDICVGDLSDAIELEDDAEHDQTAGVNAWIALNLTDSVSILGEYISAIDNIDAINGDKPQTWAIDLVYEATDAITIAARYEGSKEFLADETPESRFGGTISYAFNDVVTLSAEYLYGKYDDAAEIDDCHLVSGRLVFDF